MKQALGWLAVWMVLACSAPADLLVTLDQSDKTLTVTNSVAVRESVTVTLTNTAPSTAGNLQLILTDRDKSIYARCDYFAAAGTNGATGLLSLNTTELVDFFAELPPGVSRQFYVSVWDQVAEKLLATGVLPILNNPVSTNTPTAAGTNDLTAFQAALTNIAAMAAGATNTAAQAAAAAGTALGTATNLQAAIDSVTNTAASATTTAAAAVSTAAAATTTAALAVGLAGAATTTAAAAQSTAEGIADTANAALALATSVSGMTNTAALLGVVTNAVTGNTNLYSLATGAVAVAGAATASAASAVSVANGASALATTADGQSTNAQLVASQALTMVQASVTNGSVALTNAPLGQGSISIAGGQLVLYSGTNDSYLVSTGTLAAALEGYVLTNGSGSGLTGITAEQVGALSTNGGDVRGTVNIGALLGTYSAEFNNTNEPFAGRFVGPGTNTVYLSTATRALYAIGPAEIDGSLLVTGTIHGTADGNVPTNGSANALTNWPANLVQTNNATLLAAAPTNSPTVTNLTVQGALHITPTAISSATNLDLSLAARIERVFTNAAIVTVTGLSANLSALVVVYSTNGVPITLPAIAAENQYLGAVTTNTYTATGTNIWNIVTDSQTNVYWSIAK